MVAGRSRLPHFGLKLLTMKDFAVHGFVPPWMHVNPPPPAHSNESRSQRMLQDAGKSSEVHHNHIPPQNPAPLIPALPSKMPEVYPSSNPSGTDDDPHPLNFLPLHFIWGGEAQFPTCQQQIKKVGRDLVCHSLCRLTFQLAAIRSCVLAPVLVICVHLASGRLWGGLFLGGCFS